MKTEPNNPIHLYTNKQGVEFIGLTKREYFAAMAMQGILAASTTGDNGFYNPDKKNIGLLATEYADALINELNKSDQ